MIIVLCD